MSYNAPNYWGDPAYSVLRWTVPKSEKRVHLMSHSSEELLWCEGGPLHYQFFFSPGGVKPAELLFPVPKKELIRIRPQIPHHNYSPGTSSSGWMIVLHKTGDPNRLEMPEDAAMKIQTPSSGSSGSDRDRFREGFTEEELTDPTTYSLVAWGLSEKIRIARLRANLTIKQLAALCDIHPSYVWRLENADTNISMDTVFQMAKLLRIDLTDFLKIAACESPYSTDTDRVKPSPGDSKHDHPMLYSDPEYAHRLHPHFWCLEPNDEATIPLPRGTDDQSTFIVLEGNVQFRHFSLVAGAVLHLRERSAMGLKATLRSKLLEIRYSTVCTCKTRKTKAGN